MSSIIVSGDTSGSVTLSAPAVSGSSVLTLPVATDTLVGKATTDTLTNKSIAATQLTGTVAVANGGTGVTTSTGSGANVLGTSPTLVTPLLGTPTSGVLTNCTGIAKAALPTGSVLQVVSATKTDTFTSAVTATWTDITGISVAITPTSATSKIFLMCTVQGAIYRPGASAVMLRLVRDSTAIGIGDAASNRTRMTFGASVVSNDSVASTTVNYLDSPTTTSSTTYKVQFFQSAATIQINRTVTDADATDNGRCVSSITVMEIAG